MSFKDCIQCTNTKPITEFRKYYNANSNGRYTQCKTCEKINQRYKYLSRKQDPSQPEHEELQKIQSLYEAQRGLGGKPPGERRTKLNLDLDAAIHEANSKLADVKEAQEVGIPPELHKWLHEDLEQYDAEYLQETVYPTLVMRYRPQVSLTPDMRPVYDDTYRSTLNEILKRFDDYEDSQ